MSIQTNFQPRRREISGVTNALNAEVTTTEDHGYLIGQTVRLHVPESYGMNLDFVQAIILSIGSTTTFVTNIDTRFELPYVTPVTPPSFTQSHVVPMSGPYENDTSITG